MCSVAVRVRPVRAVHADERVHVRRADGHEGQLRGGCAGCRNREGCRERDAERVQDCVYGGAGQPGEQSARDLDRFDGAFLEREAARDVHELGNLDRRARDARADQLALEVEVDGRFVPVWTS